MFCNVSLCYSLITMEKTDPVKAEVGSLIYQNCGHQVGTFFFNSYSNETMPIFLHHSYLVLKEMIGEQKTKEQINTILRKYSVVVPYE